MQRIIFKDKNYLLIDGAIATEEQFSNNECSYAHLFKEDGEIKRFGETIGTIEDITFLADVIDGEQHKMITKNFNAVLDNPNGFEESSGIERIKTKTRKESD